MTKRYIKKELKKQAREELLLSYLNDYDDMKKIKLYLVDINKDNEYTFYDKNNNIYIVLYPYFENKKLYNAFDVNKYIY